MKDVDLLGLEDESSGKFFYVGDGVTLNVVPGVALVFVGIMRELQFIMILSLIVNEIIKTSIRENSI